MNRTFSVFTKIESTILGKLRDDEILILTQFFIYAHPPYSEAIAKRASNVSRDNLASLGVCFGKFTKTDKFTLHVTALDYLAQYAKYKIWLKNTAEMSYMYGNHVLKAHINKMTEDTPEHQGVIIYSSNDLPLVSEKGKETLYLSHHLFRVSLLLLKVPLLLLNWIQLPLLLSIKLISASTCAMKTI